MNQEKEFAILHQLADTQFLVNTGFEHNDNTYWLSYKFWSEDVNGFIQATLSWSEDKESDFERTFDKFAEIEYCKKFKLGTEAKFFGTAAKE